MRRRKAANAADSDTDGVHMELPPAAASSSLPPLPAANTSANREKGHYSKLSPTEARNSQTLDDHSPHAVAKDNAYARTPEGLAATPGGSAGVVYARTPEGLNNNAHASTSEVNAHTPQGLTGSPTSAGEVYARTPVLLAAHTQKPAGGEVYHKSPLSGTPPPTL